MWRAAQLSLILSACGVPSEIAVPSAPPALPPAPTSPAQAPPVADPPPFTPPPARTAPGPEGCPFGEVIDCEGWCAPDYLLGDGTCDDGRSFPVHFNCAAYQHDHGDCGEPPLGTTCSRVVRMRTGRWAGEVGWDLQNPDGVSQASVSEGTYGDDHRAHHHHIEVSPGNHILVGRDAYGDGWNGGVWELVHPGTGQVLHTFRMPSGSQQVWEVHIDCDDPDPELSCEASVYTHTAAHPEGLGWVLTDHHGLPLVTRIRGSLDPHTSHLHRQTLVTGTYQLRPVAHEDGWQGGRVEVVQRGGRVVGLSLGAGPARNLTIDCTRDGDAPITLPPIAVDCATLTLHVDTGPAGDELAWSLISTPDWVRRFGAGPHLYDDHAIYSTGARLHSGTWWLRLTHEGGQGWGGGSLWLTDDDDANPLLELTLGGGHQLAAPFEVTCIDEGSPEPDAPCAHPDAIPDCRSTCFPSAYLGDGICDDGTLSAADFDCAAYAWDAGDCSP